MQISLDALTACGSCRQSGGCGIQLLPKKADTPDVVSARFRGDNNAVDGKLNPQITRGDRVTVSVGEPDSVWLQVVLMAYGIPTTGLLSGAITGHLLAFWSDAPASADAYTLAGLAAGLAGGLIALKWHYQSTQAQRCFEWSVGSVSVIDFVTSTKDAAEKNSAIVNERLPFSCR